MNSVQFNSIAFNQLNLLFHLFCWTNSFIIFFTYFPSLSRGCSSCVYLRHSENMSFMHNGSGGGDDDDGGCGVKCVQPIKCAVHDKCVYSTTYFFLQICSTENKFTSWYACWNPYGRYIGWHFGPTTMVRSRHGAAIFFCWSGWISKLYTTLILFPFRRQYDVYSKDVELANKMESSGMAG